MKRSLVALTWLLVLLSCTREQESEHLPFEQLSAAQQMDESFLLAKTYNDSLAFSGNINQPVQIYHRYDSLYHCFDDLFTTSHNRYQHKNNSADHLHSSHGLVQLHDSGYTMMAGAMMNFKSCPYCSNGGHTSAIHTKMDQLHLQHRQYHP